MGTQLTVPPLRWHEKLADLLMTPVMLLLAPANESPQKTHFWNNKKMPREDVSELDSSWMAHCSGMPHTMPRKIWGIPIFHMPIIGGWRNYVVLEPIEEVEDGETWHVGWIAEDVIGVSRIQLDSQVRLLIGPGDVTFFGIRTGKDSVGTQIQIHQVGSGKLGDGGVYKKTPLL